MKEGEHCSKKRKRKSKENMSGCDSGKHIRKTQEEEVDYNNNIEKPNCMNDDVKQVTEIQCRRLNGAAGLVLGKRYTKEEDELIKKAVLDYVKKHNLGDKGIDMVMNCSQHPNLKGCWNEIYAETLLQHRRPKQSIYQRAQILCTPNRGKWTKEEINYIKEEHEKHGADWAFLAKKLGRHRVHVSNMYWLTKLPNLRKGQWTQDEYQSLFDLVHADLESKIILGEKKWLKHGMSRDNISWTAISDKLGTRHLLRCCNKWYHRLSSPMVLDGTWADTDDYRMLIALYELDASCEEEVQWDNLIEHRTGDLCRKRWKQMVRDVSGNESKSFVEQVEVLSKRYCPKMLQVREKLDNRPVMA